MGLFDNLFLDANTPVTINDGIDHSKDVIVPLPETKKDAPIASVDAGKQEVGKKDDSLVTLFDADKEDEKAAKEIMNPEPPTDIALEIGKAPTSVTEGVSDTAPSEVSFDIGGDISFDIGGDMMPNSSPAVGMVVSEPVTVVDIESIPEVLAQENVGEVSTSEASPIGQTDTTISPISDTTSADVVSSGIPLSPTDSTISITHQETKIAGSNDDNALFSLLNDTATETNIEASSVSISEPVESMLRVSENSILDMGISSAISGEDTNHISENSQGVSVGVIESPLLGENLSLDEKTQTFGHAPKLKTKLTEFLTELENMEVGDDAMKSHKMAQIDMCRTRISEIKIEYDARISALQSEMHALEKEIEDMDKEKNHIKNVIETFQKELEVA